MMKVILGALALLAAGAVAKAAEAKTAVFAGGCFWCMEPPYEKLDGVESVVSGYTGGEVANPTYKQVTYGDTGHYEAVRVTYDPAIISYERLVEVFWRNIDPFDARGQFCDKGSSYRAAIFVDGADERAVAERTLDEVKARFEKPVATKILDAGPFYEAERYHQNYYKKNPLRYRYYRSRCGRDARLKAIWGDDAAS